MAHNSMIYERLILMRDLMHEEGSIYVHMGPMISAYVKLVLDEIFGIGRAISGIT